MAEGSPDRILLVTGGSRGIGAAVARFAALRGYAVCVNYRSRQDAADAVVAAIVGAGGRAIAVQGDVAVEADVVRLLGAGARACAPGPALVNSGGVVEPGMGVERWEPGRITGSPPPT